MNSWKVTLSDGTGKVTEYVFSAMWNPEKDFITDDLIGYAAASQAWWESGKRVQYMPVATELIAPPVLH